MEHTRFPSIEQFRTVFTRVKNRANKNLGAPTVLTFNGTVKLHGTNSAVAKKGDELWFQSREHIITPDKDNAGFAAWASNQNWDSIFDLIGEKDAIIFGEWCGAGIQKGVAINQLPKMFVIFGIREHDGAWKNMRSLTHVHDNEHQIFNIHQFPSWAITIDFENLGDAQERLAEITSQVENECPVAKQLGVTEGVLTGEGVVWQCVNDPITDFTFKVKGEKHAVNGSYKKGTVAIDTEKFENINALVKNVVTENRLQQAVDYLVELHLPLENTSMAAFLRWVVNDVMKEEGDTINDSGLSPKEVNSGISQYARKWFFKYLDDKVLTA
jgi:hypothetical protein